MSNLLDSHIKDLESLVRAWQDYAAGHDTSDDMDRHAGYIAALKLCASQLSDTTTRLRRNTEE